MLDNAFDGLDVASRSRAFEQTFWSKVWMSRPWRTRRTQVLLATHRAEEIVDELITVTFLQGTAGPSGTEARNERTGRELVSTAVGGVSTCEPWDVAKQVFNVTAKQHQRFGQKAAYNNKGMRILPIVR